MTPDDALSSAEEPASTEPAVRLTLITRAQCHLCEVAKEAMARFTAETGEPWTELDVDSDPALLEEYWDRVPVILLDGKEHGYWRVEEDRLRRDLMKDRPG
jgi:glutaredoxin